ncbi:MAG: polyprenyl synthetase family protein [Paludibacteraceae bacterium]
MDTITLIRKPIEKPFADFERLFEQTLACDNPLLGDVLSYVSVRRGKQLRPMLVLLAAQLCTEATDKTLKAAVALELLHTASLIHDDVVDSSPMRRGAEAVQAKWSNKVAVLVGDYMLSKVIGIATDIHNTQILEIVSQLGRTLSSGELLQLHTNQTMWITEEQYYKIIEQKTAQLFQACAEAGAVSAGGSVRQRTALKEFGRLLGLCFQIKDDIFDFSDNDELGKPTMNDIRDGKVTLPLLVSLQRAPQHESNRIRALSEALSGNDPQVNADKAEQEIKSFVMRYQGVQYAYRQMHEYKQQAVKVLSVFRDSATKQALFKLFDYTVNRLH